MDLFQNSGAGVGNMMSQRAEASSQQAFERNKMETQKLQDSVKLAKGQVSQVGEANTMKGIQDAIVGGVLGAKIAPAVKEYRAFHNQRLQVRRDKLASQPKEVSATAGEAEADPVFRGNVPDTVKLSGGGGVGVVGSEASVGKPVESEPTAPDGSAKVKAPTVEPQEAPKPLKVVGKAGEEAGEEMTEEAAGNIGGRLMKGASLLQGAGNLYQDISTGSIGGKGSNWEQKVGNIGSMVGAVADVIPGGEVIGAGIGLVSGIFSDIGDTISGDKKKAAATANVATAQSALKTQQAQKPTQTSVVLPTVSYGRSV